jgi:hypothetical protein
MGKEDKKLFERLDARLGGLEATYAQMDAAYNSIKEELNSWADILSRIVELHGQETGRRWNHLPEPI